VEQLLSKIILICRHFFEWAECRNETPPPVTDTPPRTFVNLRSVRISSIRVEATKFNTFVHSSLYLTFKFDVTCSVYYESFNSFEYFSSSTASFLLKLHSKQWNYSPIWIFSTKRAVRLLAQNKTSWIRRERTCTAKQVGKKGKFPEAERRSRPSVGPRVSDLLLAVNTWGNLKRTLPCASNEHIGALTAGWNPPESDCVMDRPSSFGTAVSMKNT
jgi:hypothetical protein